MENVARYYTDKTGSHFLYNEVGASMNEIAIFRAAPLYK